MALLQRKHQRSNGSQPADKYGPKRLGALYEISQLLTSALVSNEQILLALLAAVTKELPLRSIILIAKTADQQKSVAWHDPSISPADLRAAEARALNSFANLTGPAPFVGASVAHPRRAQPGKFITIPLIIHGHPIFGTLHLEGLAPFDEEDVKFVSAIANQLAIALDRHQGRLNEIALREKAEELNNFKTNLVSVVSHEVGNALSVMKIATFLLKEKLPPKWLTQNKQFLDMILINIDALTGAVQNLLNMGRLEVGKLAINFTAVDAAEILRSALKCMELLCEKKALRVSLELPDDLPRVRADQASLTLVVSNLLSNAIKYTPEKGRIVLGILCEASRPGYCRIYVQDTGIGVSKEDRAKILGGHFRSESGKKMTTKGFGVGLSLAQQIIEAHDSTIEIEGRPGKGSRFAFLLPTA